MDGYTLVIWVLSIRRTIPPRRTRQMWPYCVCVRAATVAAAAAAAENSTVTTIEQSGDGLVLWGGDGPAAGQNPSIQTPPPPADKISSRNSSAKFSFSVGALVFRDVKLVSKGSFYTVVL